jgi:hypothetical protein
MSQANPCDNWASWGHRNTTVTAREPPLAAMQVIAVLGTKSISEASCRRSVGQTVARPRSFCHSEYLVNDTRERYGGVDDDAVFRNVFFRLMQVHSDIPLLWFSAPVSWVQCHSLIQFDSAAADGSRAGGVRSPVLG